MTIWHALCVESGWDIGKRQAREITIATELSAMLGPDAVQIPIQTVYERVRHGKGWKMEQTSIRTLLPRYIFATSPYPKHRRVKGVLMRGDEPYPIPAMQVARMMTAAQAPHICGEPEKVYRIGDVVQVTGFAVPVTVARVDGDRIAAVLEMFGSVREIAIHKDQIAA